MKCPQFPTQMSAGIACIIAGFIMSVQSGAIGVQNASNQSYIHKWYGEKSKQENPIKFPVIFCSKLSDSFQTKKAFIEQ